MFKLEKYLANALCVGFVCFTIIVLIELSVTSDIKKIKLNEEGKEVEAIIYRKNLYIKKGE